MTKAQRKVHVFAWCVVPIGVITATLVVITSTPRGTGLDESAGGLAVDDAGITSAPPSGDRPGDAE